MLVLSALDIASLNLDPNGYVRTNPNAYLQPITLTTGGAFLPERVLLDPEHRATWAILQNVTRRAVDWSEVIVYDERGQTVAMVGTIQEYDKDGKPTTASTGVGGAQAGGAAK